MREPNSLTAHEARSALLAGDLSALDLLEACLGQVDRIDPKVNAMVTVARERSMSEAVAVDDALAAAPSEAERRRLLAERPLLGLPVAIKDLQATAGLRTTLGSAQFADNVPTTDAGIVAKVRAAGGIVIGKTNIPERSIGANTVNRLFGATGNPFDPERSAGGSSGGSAAALAAEMAPLATGSDHGGSLRIPACYCGVVGFRATPGIVPFEERAMTQTYYSVQGPMARTVDDVALLLSVVAGRQADVDGHWRSRDPMAFPLETAGLADLDEIDPSTLRIGVSEDLGGVLVSDQVRRAFRDRVDWLATQGIDCVDVDLDLRDAAQVDWRVRADIFATYYHREASTWDAGFNPNIRAGYEAALAMPMADIAQARHRQAELSAAAQAVLATVDVVLCPGVSVAPFPWRDLYPTEVDGVPVENYMAWLTLTAAFSVIGHPVVAMPAGLDDQQLPFGIQVVGPMYGDRRLLSIAKALERKWQGTSFARPRPDFDRLQTSNVDLSPEAAADLFR